MYQYDEIDQRIVDERVRQFRDQTRRFLAGELSEDEFRPLRLQNGLYIQRHAPMLRVAIPYGLLSTRQLRMLAFIARRYDRGSAHFSTRQGVAQDEIVDPLVWAELLRQWSTFHPEFAYLPRKFKIAIVGAENDRAATLVHDIGIQAVRSDAGDVGFRIIVGGGLGRTPIIGHVVREFLPWRHLLTYLDAILRVYNRFGRRDNKYKARIKILVKEQSPDAFREAVEEEWRHLQDGPGTLVQEEVDRVEARFRRPAYRHLPAIDAAHEHRLNADKAYSRWVARNVHAHRQDGYVAVTVSLKQHGLPPGDATADQMDAVATLADRFSFGEVRVTHEQNLLLPHVELRLLGELWGELKALRLATPNIGLITNIIACPGGDYCSLANAVSIPVAEAIQERFADLDYIHDIGELDLNISGCMNSCGHHHVGHIGILGVDKGGEEWYQISIGGRQGNDAALGKVIGPSFARAQVPDVIEQLIGVYLARRDSEAERFVDVVHRLGLEPFKEAVYADAH